MTPLRLSLPWTTLFAEATTAIQLPAGNWRPCAGWAKARGTLELRANNQGGDTLSAVLVLQFANQEGDPEDSVVLGTASSTASVDYPQDYTSIVALSNEFRLARPAWQAATVGAGGLTLGRAGGYVDIVMS
jgi:hypothetical protein